MTDPREVTLEDVFNYQTNGNVDMTQSETFCRENESFSVSLNASAVD